MPQSAYLWQRQWTGPVESATANALAQESPYAELLVFGAEIVADSPTKPDISAIPAAGLDWKLLARARRPVGIVVRVRGAQGPISPQGKVFEVLNATLVSLCSQARQAGLKLAEVQSDFDCPTSRLTEYARALTVLRGQLPAERITFTALPAWLRSSAFPALAHAADGYVLQVHSFRSAGADHRPPTTLCDPVQAQKAVERAARLGVAFRVALPTYSYRLVLDAQGNLLAAAAEGAPLEQAQPPPGGSIRWLAADPRTLARLVAGWQTERPAALQGAVWYRLPVPGSDRLNWPPVTLAAVMAGRVPLPRLQAELTPPRQAAEMGRQGTVFELSLRNAGEAEAPLPTTMEVQCTATPLAFEGIGAYEAVAAQARGTARPLLSWQRRESAAEQRLPPGRILPCGWLRLPAGSDGKPNVVLPSDDER